MTPLVDVSTVCPLWGPIPTLIADLEQFVYAHRPHGELVADAGLPSHNGYRLEVCGHCGGRVRAVVTPDDAGVELALLARWN